MATPSHAQAVKSLNNTADRRRFVFKSFHQRIDDIEIDVYRSLDKIKSEPSQGSSFFRDCLIEWRELNTAEDFISFYEEMMPFVQTLPLVLLHKESIFSGLLSRLQIKSRLSVEPILRLIATLSRDLLEDFIPFLPKFADSLVRLLENGADREPEIIEQIFVSWSYIMMYLQKYLVQDIVNLLKLTVKLRYYPKVYVQEFMAAALSFSLRNAPKDQLAKGIRKIMFEVVKKPLDIRKSGVSALLFYVLRGASSRFHSKAERVLKALTDYSLFAVGETYEQGSDTVVEVISTAFERLCEELEMEELHLMWNCLYRKIDNSIKEDNLQHLIHLLSLLTRAVQIDKGRKVPDYQPMLDNMGALVQKYSSSIAIGKDEHTQKILDKILQLMPCVLDGLNSFNNISAISNCSTQWAPVLSLRNSSCLTFMRELLARDMCILQPFADKFLSAMNDLIETSQEEVIFLLLSFCEKLQRDSPSTGFFDELSKENISRIRHILEREICSWGEKFGVIEDIRTDSPPPTPISQIKLSMLWGVICCYPSIMDTRANSSLLMDLINGLDQLIMTNAETVAGISKDVWQSLLGAALKSYYRHGKNVGHGETRNFLHLAKVHKSSPHVLSAVADFLDFVDVPGLQEEASHTIYQPEFVAEKFVDALDVFADNLCNPDKGIRLPTLRILCHYEPLGCVAASDEQPPPKRRKTEVSEDGRDSDVIKLLLMIEETPVSISTSRKVTLLISKIQMAIAAGRICDTYIPIILSGMIGIFHNRFSYLWDPASECLAVLISKHFRLVWDKFALYLEKCQSLVQTNHDHDGGSVELSDTSIELLEQFNSFIHPESDGTPYTTVLSSLLKTLQKIPAIAESRSRQIIPLFLKFLGYDDDSLVSAGSFNSDSCKGKEWKTVLKEWLKLLKLMRNSKAFYHSRFLKDVLAMRLLDDNDAEVQMKVLDCLLNWKDDFLLPYEQQLRNLISLKTFREELTTWSLSRESHLIDDSHRANLVPLVILLLMPKVRKLKTLASRKQASVHHRKAILRFIAQLDVNEMSLFFALLIKPLSMGADGTKNFFWNLHEVSMEGSQALNMLKYFTVENISALSWKKRYGFLHVVEEILGVFDELQIKPFLNLLMGFVVRILRSCTSSLVAAKCGGTSLIPSDSSSGDKLPETDNVPFNQLLLTNTAIKQFKDLRSLCLKFISLVLDKYDDYELGSEYWDIFFTAVEPLIDNFKQEGSSSERPSSLFSCFLAMSRSYHLVPLLCRKTNLAPDIFSILKLTTASEAVKLSVIKFIENLLSLDQEHREENSAVKKILLPNIDGLISSLHSLFQSNSMTKRKFARSPAEAIRIFKLLSKYTTDQSSARKFVDVLLPLMVSGLKDSDVCVECLQVIRDTVPVLGNEITTEILHAVSPLLIKADQDMRQSICDLLDALAKTDPSVLLLAKVIRELNATSATEMGDLDYDRIINAYENINISFFGDIGEDHALVVLSHCVYDMSSGEIILRNSAYRALLSFVEFSTFILDEKAKTSCGINQERVSSNEDCWTKACIQRIIRKFLVTHLGNAMRAGTSMKEWIELLRDMVSKLPDVGDISAFRILCSEDVEQDFFHNIVHLQILSWVIAEPVLRQFLKNFTNVFILLFSLAPLQSHRRARAITRFANAIKNTTLSEAIINKVFVPLFFNMLLNTQNGKGEHIKTACLEAISSASAHMEWKSYYGLLSRCFREMKMNMDKQKILLRLICSILDQFHFLEICSKDNVIGAPGNTLPVLQKCGTSITATEIQGCLHKTVLPKIQKFLSSDSDKINVRINVAALKVLKLLPADIMDSQLPSIIHRIANRLKNRLESVRDEARLALTACLRELGLEYLQFVIGVLRATLKRGYELHVLGYSLHFILSKFLSNALGGKLDYCLDDLLSVVESDILGDVDEEKEVEKIASKMKETKKRKSFETLKMIAQGITFKNNALKLLTPVTAHMQKHITPKLKTKLENMLSHIAAGIECNPSVGQTQLLIFIYRLIESEIVEETSRCKRSSGGATNVRQKDVVNEETVLFSHAFSTKSATSHLITAFALRMFHNHLQNNRKDKKNEQLLSMLDPFVRPLGNYLSSKYEDVVSAALRCLTFLVKLPLPSLASHADEIKVTLLDIAQSTVNANSPLMESCLRLLTVLLQSTTITLSSEQLHLLIQFPLFVDLERSPSFIALSLLKAIVSRKLVVNEIYDVVIQVAELMVRSHDESIRKKCSQVLLQFLLDYRLSEKYLRKHVDFLLRNLSYEHSSGRKAVLEMLHAIIIKFPKSFLDEHAQTLFIHLVQCLANDNDNKVRSMTGVVIKNLVEHISPHLLDSIFDFSLSWYMNEKPQVQSLGAQAVGLLVEVMTKSSQKHINTILPVAKNILLSVVNFLSDEPQQELSAEACTGWKEAYYSLVMLEKILHQFHELSFDRNLEDIWGAICNLLLHPHTWLRHISSRLMAFYFDTAMKASREKNKEKMLGTLFLTRPSILSMIAGSFCCQLKTVAENDNEASNLIIKNLVFTISAIHSLMGKEECGDPCKFWSSLEQHEQGYILKAFQLFESRKGKDKFLYLVSGVRDQNDGEQSENLQNLLVSNLLKRMGKIALQMQAVQMRIVFDCFGRISSQMTQVDCQNYAFDFLQPVYKVCEGFSGKVVSDDLKQLAEEVRENIRNKLGIQNFVQVYSEIKNSLKSKRDKRRQEEKRMAVVNPMRNAKRKLRLAAKHREHKRRKMMKMKNGRQMR